MAKKQFKTESKKLLDMMVNSIYTHKEIFLRELISNASDAIDKLYFRSLTDDSVGLKHSDFEIRLAVDKENRILTVTDNGIGMTKDELENNLGTIAKSGSLDFKSDEENKNDKIDIIGQFGVGFYSAFMVADNIKVESRAYGSDEAFVWESSGADGYTVKPCDKDTVGTVITLHIKEDTEEEKYGEFLETYRIRELIKKYSDYIRYPIKMLTSHRQLKEGTENEYEDVYEDETLNSMTPIWKKPQSKVKDEEYAEYYKAKFADYEAPLKVIRQSTEGNATYTALLFIPAHAPYDYYSRDYEKGLQLYSSSVMIMEKCKDLLPDHFSFVKGLVDSADLSLNISREMLQHDRQLKIIAKALEKKIASELGKMLKSDREKYEQFFKEFGAQLKWGIYSTFGANREELQDLLLFKTSADAKPGEVKFTTLKEYVDRARENQDKIYYAVGETAEKIAMLPQVESVLSKGYEVLYLTEDIDEFCVQILRDYDKKAFLNVCTDNLDLGDEEEKAQLKEANDNSEELFKFMKESIGDKVAKVRYTNTLKNHAVCLSSEGNVSVGMEQILNKMPGTEGQNIKAETVLEINMDHPIKDKLLFLFGNDKEKLADYSKILYAQARLINGLNLENPAEISDLVCDLMV
ncbi:molecular chaperone HtpG [uncultured Ruminococcus sp.]|uniref:molecular chaperone HtpG n=1 Tax=uncultured Ruminococcus sp. TaxID=165186 RepID=UPI00292D61B7|nr:molecular chaperone HtpG [uncultured Ruminococcus sp.]